MFEMSKMFQRSLLILGFLGFSSLVSHVSAAPAEKPAPSAHEAKSTDTVIMKINGQAIMKKQFDDVLSQAGMQEQMMAMQQGGSAPTTHSADEVNAQKAKVRDEMIKYTILQQAVDKQVSHVKEEAIQNELKKIKKYLAKDNKTLDQFLKQKPMTMADLMKVIRERMAAIDVVVKEAGTVDPSDQEVKDIYEKDKSQMSQVRASHILFGYKEKPGEASGAPPAAEKAALKKKAEEVLKQVKAGEDFAKLAKQYSSCPSATKGGDLGSFGRGRMTPTFEEAAFKLKPQEVSDIVETPFGFHIIKVTEVNNPTYDEMKDQIKDQMRMKNMQQKMDVAAAKLRSTAKIEFIDQELAKLKAPAASAMPGQ